MDALFELFTELGGDPFKQLALSRSPGAAGLSPAQQELLSNWRQGRGTPGFEDLRGYQRAALFGDPGPDTLPDPDVPEYAG